MHAHSQNIQKGQQFFEHAAENELTDSIQETFLQQADTLRALSNEFDRGQYRRALGLMLANVPAVWLGHRAATALPRRTVNVVSSCLFALLGIAAALGVSFGM